MPNRRKKANFLAYLIAIVVIIVILLVVFGRGVKKPAPTLPSVVDTQIQKLQTQSTSDEVAVIEKDLQETNLSPIDTELKEVENSLQNL